MSSGVTSTACRDSVGFTAAAVMVTVARRAAACARAISDAWVVSAADVSARALSAWALSGRAGCCAATHIGAATQAQTINWRNMVSVPLEKAPQACPASHESAASGARRTDWWWEAERGRPARACAFNRTGLRRPSTNLVRNDRDRGLSELRAHRADAQAVVAAAAGIGAAAVVARMFRAVLHLHAAGVLRHRTGVREQHRGSRCHQ